MLRFAADLVRAARSLRRSPGFGAVAVLTLALGIGAVTTVFTLVDSILIEPLPYPASERLVAIGHSAPGIDLSDAGLSEGTYLHYREHSRAFEAIGAYYENVVSLTGEGEPERVPVAMVTDDFFEVLGARTAVGRLPTSQDAAPGAEVVVVISHELWTRRYGANPAIVGSMIEANRGPRRVIGVLEPGFGFPQRGIGIWYASDPDPTTARASDFFQLGIGRLKPGVGPEAAEQDLNRLIQSLPEAYPDFTAGMLDESEMSAVVTPLKDVIVGEARAALWLLLAGMAFLLLIACANVANLFLIRGEHRQKEIAVRSALGAGRGDLAHFFAAESLIVAVVGGALGLAVADVALQLLVAYGPQNLPRLDEVGIDWRVVSFATALSVTTALFFAFVPMFKYARPALASMLKEGGFGATSSRERQRARRFMVTGQVALALTLLVGSALMAQSFWRLAHTNPGFDAEGLFTAEIAMPYTGYEEYVDSQWFWQTLLARVRALPGVEAAGMVSGLPLVPKPAYYDFALDIEGRPDETRAAVTVYQTTAGYLDAMRIPVVAGRGISAGELATGRPVLLSAAAARRLFPGEDAIGERVRLAIRDDHPWATIVGVVGDVPKLRIGGDAAGILYVPVLAGTIDPWLWPRHGTLIARTSLPPMSLAPAIRRIVGELDPYLPLANLRPMQSIVAESMSRTSFTMVLLLVAAAAALLLGAIGLYGVVSYAVSRRTHEIGIRMALGGRAADVRRMVLAESVALVFAGVAIGIVAALALTRFLRGLLYEVSPTDPVSFVATALLLLGTALLATWLPARRAARVDPMVALRRE